MNLSDNKPSGPLRIEMKLSSTRFKNCDKIIGKSPDFDALFCTEPESEQTMDCKMSDRLPVIRDFLSTWIAVGKTCG